MYFIKRNKILKNTSNAIDMQNMFQNCSSLIKLNLSNLDITKVTNMINMFNGCSSLKELDLSNLSNDNLID